MKNTYIKKKYIMYVVLIVLVLSIFFSYKRKKSAITTFSLPIVNKVICIDPGHGGIDSGAISKDGIREDKINLQISLKLKRLIEQSNGIVIMTRESEKGLYTEKSETIKQKKNEDLKNRKIIANESNCDIFLTIHLNSFPISKYCGAQTFYKKNCEKSKKIAYIIQEELRNELDENNDRVPQSRHNVYLLNNVESPSVLIECGFLSNPREKIFLTKDKYQEKIAWAIYIGIIRYFNEM